jgi:hypothetical protein
MPKICYKMVKIRHKFVRNPEKKSRQKCWFSDFFYKITIVERLLTGKLLTVNFQPEYFPPIRYIQRPSITCTWQPYHGVVFWVIFVMSFKISTWSLFKVYEEWYSKNWIYILVLPYYVPLSTCASRYFNRNRAWHSQTIYKQFFSYS